MAASALAVVGGIVYHRLAALPSGLFQFFVVLIAYVKVSYVDSGRAEHNRRLQHLWLIVGNLQAVQLFQTVGYLCLCHSAAAGYQALVDGRIVGEEPSVETQYHGEHIAYGAVRELVAVQLFFVDDDKKFRLQFGVLWQRYKPFAFQELQCAEEGVDVETIAVADSLGIEFKACIFA